MCTANHPMPRELPRTTCSQFLEKLNVPTRNVSVIGVGTHSVVWKWSNVKTGEVFAVKGPRSPSVNGHNSSCLELRHENVVSCRNSVDGTTIMEYVDGGSLADLMERTGGCLSASEVINITAQILNGLEYIHSRGVIHRDIKPANILLDAATHTVKIADIASASDAHSAQHNGVTVPIGTPSFLAPEVVRGKPHTQASDVWALGCCVLSLLTGTTPWEEEDNQFAVLFKVGSGQHPPIPSEISGNARSFLLACFQPCGSRPVPRDLLTHPFLADRPPAGPQL